MRKKIFWELLIAILCILLPIYSCNNKETVSNNKIQDNMIDDKLISCIDIKATTFEGKNKLIEYVEKEKIHIESDGYSTYLGSSYDKESMPLVLPLVSYWLNKEGYKTPTEETYYLSIKKNFNLEPTSIRFVNDNKGEYLEYCMYDDGADYEMIGDGSLIFAPKYKLLYRVKPLSELVTVEEGQYLTCISQAVLHYNKFLFNNSNASLTWLINNDIEFLKLLIIEFGYDKDDKLNKAVLNYILKEFLEKPSRNSNIMQNLFARKNSGENLQISDNLMKYISSNYDKQDETPIEMLNNYGYIMANLQLNDHDILTSNFSKEERFKIAAYCGYYELLAREKNNIDNPESPLYVPQGWNPGSFLRNELVSNQELLRNIKSNNYYSLPNFENMINTILNQIDIDSDEYQRTHNF